MTGPRIRLNLAVLFAFLFVLPAALPAEPNGIPTPSEFLGFQVGADRQLADYGQIVAYLKKLESVSKRIQLEDLGPSTQGRPIILAAISSEENLKNKQKYQEIARKLADPRGLSGAEIDKLITEGKAIVLVTCNIHASEIAATQMAMEWAHGLVTARDQATLSWLDSVILLLVPSLNPDGQVMEVEWYRKYVGTPFEGGRMPWLYHPYAGHDNNRDWFMLTQKESKAVNRAVYFEWYPQVWLDEHQMGSTGPRMFVPPYSNPVAERLHPLLWRAVDHLGTMMSWRLELNQKSGVIYGYVFDAYWPGGTKNTAWWKNIVGLLTEVASCRLATPIEIAPVELRGGGKGLAEYRRQTNFPSPWPGGTWRLRDIMDYERIASDALLEACSVYRADLLKGKVQMSLDSLGLGKAGEYYKICERQRDPVAAFRLAHLIRENGAEVFWSGSDRAFYIPTHQPMARFLEEVLNKQRYPKIKPTASSDYFTPYDVTTWSLPLMMGVEVEKTTLSSGLQQGLRPILDSDWPESGLAGSPNASMYAISHESNAVTLLINKLLKNKQRVVRLARQAFTSNGADFPAGTLLLEPAADLADLARASHVRLQGLAERPTVATDVLRGVRVGLYRPWTASMDEGWTRWVLEQYDFNLKNIDNQAVKSGNIAADFDVVLIPDLTKEVIVDGKPQPRDGAIKYTEDLPPEYVGGIGKEGVKNLKEFVEKGGTIVALSSGTELLMDEFNIPVANALPGRSSDFNCPGSLLRIHVANNHPVTYGMPEEAVAFLGEPLAFRTAITGPALSKEILAYYPEDAEDVLVSGWIRGAEKLERTAAAVALTYGKGKIVLFGFPVQYRAQMESTFKLLFNALHWAGMSEGPGKPPVTD
ncbi:MAG: M14 family zinc carboxypeptidase [Acidobacteriota bacterium]